MAKQNAYDYYLKRAAMERELARTAVFESATNAHLEAAVRYENLAQKVALEEILSARRVELVAPEDVSSGNMGAVPRA